MRKIEDICGIYEIVNVKNNKRYIGLSKHCKLRQSQHLRSLRKNRHHNIHLQNSFNYYGEDYFKFNIIEECEESKLVEREIYWIDYYDSFRNGYNMSGGGDGTTQAILSEERNEKIRKSMTGKKFPQNSGSNAYNARKVVCINTGKVYECIKETLPDIGVTQNHVTTSCREHTTIGKNHYVFMYYEDYINTSEKEKKEILEKALKRRNGTGRSRKVICLNTLEVYSGSREASELNGGENSYTVKCCKNQVASSGKSKEGTPLTWMWFDEYMMADNQYILDKLAKAREVDRRVICIETKEVFPSIKKVCEYFDIECTGIQKHMVTKGFHTFRKYGEKFTLKFLKNMG